MKGGYLGGGRIGRRLGGVVGEYAGWCCYRGERVRK